MCALPGQPADCAKSWMRRRNLHLAPVGRPMSENEFELRPGRIRARGGDGSRSFVGVALAAAKRAGGVGRQPASRRSVFGRGRAASLAAQRGLGPRTRGAVVKARVVRNRGGRAPLATHLNYLQREGVTKDGERGQMFEAGGDGADAGAFAARCEPDRHHFRFIVSPDDAEQLADLRAYTRDLMSMAERDLGTRLDWVAVDHWNTAHPHVHVIVRGRGEDGQDLVISRDYIREGLRARAGELVTLELGLRTDVELQRRLDQEVGAERWTSLDRSLARLAAEQGGQMDLRPPRGGGSDALRQARLGRVRMLAAFGLAEEVQPGIWRLAADAETTLREIGRRGDIIARIHRALDEQGTVRDPSAFVLSAGAEPVVGRLTARGLDDELTGSGFAIIDGVDGRTHHVALRDLDEAMDAAPGAIVEASAGQWDRRQHRLRVRSDLSLAQQVSADGATWLDRQLVGRGPEALAAGGFGEEVRRAMDQRIDHLADRGLARRSGQRVLFARDLLETLRARDLDAAARRLESQTGAPHTPTDSEGRIGGVYRQRLVLASGRFAVIDDGLGFTLVPWRPELERHFGRHVEGTWAVGRGVDWSFSRVRGIGR